MCGRRISGWSSFWRRSRSLARSSRGLSVNWLSRRTTAAGTTAPTEHKHPIISIRLWLRVYVSTFLQQRLRGGVGQKVSDVCVCVFVYLCCVITCQSHRAGLDLLSGVLELDFFLPDRDETVHALLSEAAQLNQDETSNPPQMEEFWDKDREFAAISFASFGNRKGAWSH